MIARTTLLLCLALPTALAAGDYAMYVWKEGFDATVPGCDETKLLAWDDGADPGCYTHTWDSPARRQWLWDTANRPGREMGRLFISDIKPRLEDAYFAADCSDPDVTLVKGMLKDGHCKAPGIIATAVYDGHRAARGLGMDTGAERRERAIVAR